MKIGSTHIVARHKQPKWDALPGSHPTGHLLKPTLGTRYDDDEDSEIEPRHRSENHVQIFRNQRQQNIDHVFLINDIVDPTIYIPLVQLINNAEEQDIIYLHFNCSGGQIMTGIQIVNAVVECRGRVIGVLDSHAYSMAAMLFLACDEWIVHDDCSFMLHNYSSGRMPSKGNEQLAEVSAMMEWFRDLMHRYTVPFLTDDELTRLTKGEDFWMKSDEVRERLARVATMMQEQEQQLREREQAESDAAFLAEVERRFGSIPQISTKPKKQRKKH